MSTRLLSIFECAEKLGVTDKTLRNWSRVGRGPKVYRIGVALKYREHEIEAWIDAQEIEAEPLAA